MSKDDTKRVSRREFLRLAGIGVGASLLAACAGQAPAAPTAAPAAPTAAAPAPPPPPAPPPRRRRAAAPPPLQLPRHPLLRPQLLICRGQSPPPPARSSPAAASPSCSASTR